MKLDLTPILNKRVPAISFDFTVNPDEIEDAVGLPDDITLTDGIRVSGKITDNDGYMTLSSTVSASYETVCDRCLAPISDTIEIPFDRIAVVSVSASNDMGMEPWDVLLVSEGGIDFDRDIIEELSLELPVYHLCSEDCPGLCSVCGKRLDGSCRCKAEKEIDPRLESFQKLLEKMKKE